jgi:hypothetical protein
MAETIKFWIYQLCRKDSEDDWNSIEKFGDPAKVEVEKVVDQRVISDCGDYVTLGGYGKDNKYYQFDSYPAFCSSGFFRREYEVSGLYVKSRFVEVNLKDIKET